MIVWCDNEDLNVLDGELWMVFGWVVGDFSMLIIVSVGVFIELWDMVFVMDFLFFMNDDSEFCVIDWFG